MDPNNRIPLARKPGRLRAPRGNRGSALAYLTATMVALLSFASLAVDLGRVYVVRSELQLAADAAARYGVTGISSGVTTAENYAIDAANDNNADGSPVALTAATDIEFGTWDTSSRTFTVLTGSARSGANAMRVTARRTSTNGGGVPLMFARVLGKTACNVTVTSIAYANSSVSASGIVGLSDITMKNNTFIGGYNSAVTTNPTQATATSAGNLSSNGAISGGSNNDLSGSVLLGPSAPNVTGVNVSGSTTRASSSIPAPTQATWSPTANPNGVPQNYSVGSNTMLPGGTYWFTSLSVQASLTFSGPATVYVNGNVDVQGALRAYNLIPGNLKIRQIGNNRTFGNANADDMDIVADIEAPGSDFVTKNNLHFRGRMVFRSIDVKNNADIYYDVALGGASGGGGSPVMTVR